MDRETRRQLMVLRLSSNEHVEIPAGANVVNSWIEAASPTHAGSTVLVLIDVHVLKSESEEAWDGRWNIAAADTPRGQENGIAAARSEPPDRVAERSASSGWGKG